MDTGDLASLERLNEVLRQEVARLTQERDGLLQVLGAMGDMLEEDVARFTNIVQVVRAGRQRVVLPPPKDRTTTMPDVAPE